MAELSEKEVKEAQSLQPFSEHRVLTTSDLDSIADYVGKKNKPARSASSGSKSRSSSKSKTGRKS